MKNLLIIALGLLALLVFVYWILPTALYLLIWTAVLLGVGYAVYWSTGKAWREKQTRLTVGGQAKQEKRAHKTAEKSLKEMERKLAAPTADEHKKQPLRR